VSLSSPIAFVPHQSSLLPSAQLHDCPYSVGCKPPLTIDKLVPHVGMPHRQGPTLITGDQSSTHHRRDRSSSILQDLKAMVMLSHFPPSFLDFPLFTHLSMKQASICLLRSSCFDLHRRSFSDLGPAPLDPSQELKMERRPPTRGTKWPSS
jgi:hypothetical protein